MGRRREWQSDAPVVQPLDVDGVRTVAIITVLWAVAFVVLAFQRGALIAADNGWWLWTCLAGVGFGLIGLEYCRKRRDAIAEEELRQEADAGFDDGWPDAEQPDGLAAEDPLTVSEGVSADQRLQRHPPAEPPREGPAHAEPGDNFGYGTAEGVEQVPYPGDQYDYREGRPPPGYVTTSDLPVVPRQPASSPPPQAPAQQPPRPEPSTPAPAAPQWQDQWPPEAQDPTAPPGPPPGQPGLPYQTAAPAGYSPEPDLARRHPRDIELARRREEEFDPTGEFAAPSAPVEFLRDEPEPEAPESTPPLLGSEPETGWPAEHDTSVAPPSRESAQPGPPPAAPDLVSEFFSDLPSEDVASEPAASTDEDEPDLLLGDKPHTRGRRARRDPGSGSTGEYRGRRARRD